MDSSLWEKLARLARRGERVVVVEGNDAIVLLPLGEYERLSNGEASLQHLTSTHGKIEDDELDIPFDAPDDEELNELMEESVNETNNESKSTPINQPLAPDQLEEEERFYLEPIE